MLFAMKMQAGKFINADGSASLAGTMERKCAKVCHQFIFVKMLRRIRTTAIIYYRIMRFLEHLFRNTSKIREPIGTKREGKDDFGCGQY